MSRDDLRESLEELRASLTDLINGQRGPVAVLRPYRFRGDDRKLCEYLRTLAGLTGDERVCRRVGEVIEEVEQQQGEAA